MSDSLDDLLTPDAAASLAAAAMDAGLTAGADAADAVVLAGRSVSTTIRSGAIEEAEQAESLDIGLRVFVGTRSALVGVGSQAAIKDAAERAVAMARAAPPDDTAGLPDGEGLANGAGADLEIYDPAAPSLDALIERAHVLEHAMLHVPGVTKSGGVSASAGHAVRGYAASSGFSGAYRTSTHSHSAMAIAGDGTRMERDYWYSSRRHLADLEDAATVGRLAAERTVKRLGAEPISTRTATIIFEPRTATGFVRHLLSAVSGSAVARKASFLAGKIGETVYPAGISVRDDPAMVRGQASRPFDGEGMATGPLDIVSDGVLAAYLLDTQSAKKLGLSSNGRAARGTGAPSPSATNVSVSGGSGTLETMISDAGTGLLVTDLIGVGANIVNGNYSRGAAGFWFEGGEIVGPVAEITIAGSLPDMFARAVFADDAPGLYTVDAPSVMIADMAIGGR